MLRMILTTPKCNWSIIVIGGMLFGMRGVWTVHLGCVNCFLSHMNRHGKPDF